ncbi:MAG: phasin family protein [Rhodomicrobium sp.]
MADNPFEMPQQMRDLTEQNLKQAHAAYEQLADFMTQSMSAWMGAMPASAAAGGFKEVQDRAVEIAKQNADAAFALADKISKSTDLQEILSLQTRFAQDQMQAFASQTQELHKQIGDAVQKAQRG